MMVYLSLIHNYITTYNTHFYTAMNSHFTGSETARLTSC